MQRICVIIPMFGQEEYTRKCIDSCMKHAGIVHDILVVDDCSPTPFVDERVNIIRLAENSGFTAATNAGILWAQDRGYEFVHLLNNDTEGLPNFIKILLDILDADESVAIASSARIYPKGGVVELYGADLIRGFQIVMKESELIEDTIQCNWVPVCSSLIRMSVIRELGLLNKRMRNHSSDLEYCLRIKIAGYTIVVDTRSKVLHHHEVTTKHNKIVPEQDQRVLLEILSGVYYAQFMKEMPLDPESGTYGRLVFDTVKL